MRKLWLIFTQTLTVSLAVLFAVKTFLPEWFGKAAYPDVVAVRESDVSSPPSAAASSYRDAARKALPSVVHIFTSQKIRVPPHPLADDPLFQYFFGMRPEPERRTSGLGSGVIVTSSGYVLTNFHVVNAADQIKVSLGDGSARKAHIVGSDPESDLAVLRIDPGNAPLPPMSAITFGRMEDISVGDVVLAIGNPFGVGQTVTLGIVSALGRSHLGINTFENFIQTDAAINPGNSGGALVDSHGNLVGINTAIYSRSGGSLGIGFAIPVSTARSIMEEIVRTGSVTRGWIGVETQEITPELAESFDLPDTGGVLISGVRRGSPADMGGMRPGDALLSVDGRDIKDSRDMLDTIAARKPGSILHFRIWREKKIHDIPVQIGKRPPTRHQPN